MKSLSTKKARRHFISADELLYFLDLNPGNAPYTILPDPCLPFLVPLSFASRMQKGDWHDPLLLQVLPRGEERMERQGFVSDAVHDCAAQKEPWLLHKYCSRALLLSSPVCAVRCRYCFRREFPFRKAPISVHEFGPALEYIAATNSISEVVLSGGDPLCLSSSILEDLLQRIISIPHVRTVRIHTRVPVVDPDRINTRVIDLFRCIAGVKTCVIVIHANHAAELIGDAALALVRLRATGVLLLNQSVLLRGINDSVECLEELCRCLVEHGVLPYYLHQLDRVRGSWHFEVDVKEGKRLLKELRKRLPGYMVPRYVRDVAGRSSKTLIV